MEGGCFPLLLYAAFLLCLIPTSHLKGLHFGHCVVSVDLYEIRKGFGDIKEMTSEDRYCFLQYLLEFYLVNVFNQRGEGSNFYQRRISRIANNFLSIKKELALCDPVMMCPGGMKASHSHEQILSQFQRMDSHSAALKALGELDILLDWIEKTD